MNLIKWFKNKDCKSPLMKKKKVKLSDLLSQVKEENQHKEIDTGENVGNEVW